MFYLNLPVLMIIRPVSLGQFKQSLDIFYVTDSPFKCY